MVYENETQTSLLFLILSISIHQMHWTAIFFSDAKRI